MTVDQDANSELLMSLRDEIFQRRVIWLVETLDSLTGLGEGELS
tara:strand:- start:2 stop:133 length:132 start_codon:yes stop_codon:yes gene_type:complete